MYLKNCILILNILLLHIHSTLAQNTLKFSTEGQRFGVMDLDHFWLSNSPSEEGIYFEKRGESISGSTVGMPIFRSNAKHDQVWGQIGTEEKSGFSAKSGAVWYDNIPGSGTKYLKLRYSKHSPSTVPMEIFINDKKQAEYLPVDQGNWNQFAGSISDGTEWIPINFPLIPAEIEVNPQNWNFGIVSQGTWSEKEFLISNLGGENLSINSVSFQGGNASAFRITEGGGSFSLAPNETRSLIIRYQPESSGTNTTLLRITSSDPDEGTIDITLKGLDSANQIILEDYSDIITPMDLGFNDFSGNAGILKSKYGANTIECAEENNCHLNFEWDFGSINIDDFTGIFMALFGLTDTQTTYDKDSVEKVSFPEHSLDFDNIDGPINLPQGKRKIEEFCLEILYDDPAQLQLKLELKDNQDNIRFVRIPISQTEGFQTLCWDFRDPNVFTQPRGALDLNKVKEMALIVERLGNTSTPNPIKGNLKINKLWFNVDKPEFEPESDEELLDLLKQRVYQYFYDWSGRKDAIKDLPQDRSIFGDLITVGGVGFAIPAHVIAAENGWISREEAAEKVKNILTVLDSAEAFGYEPLHHKGYRGWYYHFLGVDGDRKVNFDFENTAKDESKNTVELSSIDTGLALMGALSAQSYFNHNNTTESEIREKVQRMYDRVDWNFMLDSTSQQFYLGWMPIEEREGPPFSVPDGEGRGFFSGTPEKHQTLDFYTDEALILILLGLGAKENPIPFDTYCALHRTRKDGLIQTFPGALFTYQFFHAFFDTNRFFPPCSKDTVINWFDNSRLAIQKVMEYTSLNPENYPTYGVNEWGISAAEGPSDKYHAYGVPPLAYFPEGPEQDGTVTYYAMFSSINYGEMIKNRAISALRAAWERGHWHPRFGLPDSFNDDVSLAIEEDSVKDYFRSEGPWVNRALFAIDQGPMLLHLENQKSGLIWRLIEQNPNIIRALSRLAAQPEITVSPDMWDFGVILKGDSAKHDFIISNEGNATLRIDSMKVVGRDSSMFYFDQTNFPFEVKVNEQDTVWVTFKPNTDSIKIASLIFCSNDGNKSLFKVPLIGKGVMTNLSRSIYVDVLNFRNFPNPFSSKTTIEFFLKQPNHIKLSVRDILGKLISPIINQTFGPGLHQIAWNAENIPSGLYLLEIEANGAIFHRKITILR